MAVNHVRNIQDHFALLIERTHEVSYLSELLKNKGTISEDDYTTIQTRKSEKDKARTLYEMALRFGKKKFYSLYNAVWSTGQRDVAAILKPRVFQKGQSFVELNCINGDHGDFVPIDKFNVSVIMSQEIVSNDFSQVYKMSSVPKGYALIIDNRTYEEADSEVMYKEREDVESLFIGLDFEVDLYVNINLSVFIDKMVKFASLEEHNNADCSVVFVMADGSKDSHSYMGINMSTADKKLISTEWILHQFTESKCPQLKSKPKLFFFQSTKYQYIMNYTRVPMEVEGNLSPDTLIASACYADITNGSGFSHIICDVFMNKACNTDVLTMLREVSRRMKMFHYDHTGPVSLRINTKGFDKKLYFNPGLFQNE